MSDNKWRRHTDWGNMWWKISQEIYPIAMEIAEHPNLMVNIYEVEDVGWVIEPRNILPDFWLDVCFTKQQAIDLCYKMDWSIR